MFSQNFPTSCMVSQITSQLLRNFSSVPQFLKFPAKFSQYSYNGFSTNFQRWHRRFFKISPKYFNIMSYFLWNNFPSFPSVFFFFFFFINEVAPGFFENFFRNVLTILRYFKKFYPSFSCLYNFLKCFRSFPETISKFFHSVNFTLECFPFIALMFP